MSNLLGALSLAGAASVAGGYKISRSLRFNSADSAYLNRTPASASNRKTWTWSGWVKRSGLGTLQELFNGNWANNDNGFLTINFSSADKFEVQIYNSVLRITTQVFRDVSAWYHFVVAVDTTQATAANRVKVYLNGLEITSFSTNNAPTLNLDTAINYNGAHYIGTFSGSQNLFNGYMTEVNLIDGQALDPSYFGEFSTDTGVWAPKRYVGEYGTNGFFLNFSDNSGVTSTTLGKDQVGSNNWTPNGFSVTAGAGNDSLVDVPTLFGTDTGIGGEVRGNYCTANPLNKSANTTSSNGNLDVATGAAAGNRTSGTLGVSSGKWYFEATRTDAEGIGNIVALGVMNSASALSTGQYSANPTNSGATANEWALTDRGVACNNTTYTNLSSTIGTIDQNDVVQVCIDMDAKKIWFGIDDTFSGSPSAGTGEAFSNLPTSVVPLIYVYSGSKWVLNFGQRAFEYTAPSGFKALVTTNLPDPTVIEGDEYFNTVLYTGDRTDRTITVGFQPDFVWVKSRNAVDDHYLMNSLSGVGKYLVSNSTAAEATNAPTLTAFDSTGFSVGNTGTTNETGRTYASWSWKANGAGVSNTDGTISSTVSANTDAGFSIVTWTGNGVGGATVGHGLAAAPQLIISKARNQTEGWYTYTTVIDGSMDYLFLNTIAAAANSGLPVPTSTVIHNDGWSAAYNMLAYCFHSVTGFSKIGTYTGNGSTDGSFVFTGFRPAWMMIKRSSGQDNWMIHDTTRDPFNLANKRLMASGSDAESTADNQRDILSNGFKLRSTNTATNQSGQTYIYMAFSEVAFKYSLAR